MAKKVSRRLQELQKKVEDRPYLPLEALQLLKETATAKFGESAEAHIRLGIDPGNILTNSCGQLYRCQKELVK